jgi:hypothetical protein
VVKIKHWIKEYAVPVVPSKIISKLSSMISDEEGSHIGIKIQPDADALIEKLFSNKINDLDAIIKKLFANRDKIIDGIDYNELCDYITNAILKGLQNPEKSSVYYEYTNTLLGITGIPEELSFSNLFLKKCLFEGDYFWLALASQMPKAPEAYQQECLFAIHLIKPRQH